MKFSVFILFIFLSGCYNQRKAQQQVMKADSSYPYIIAKLCADKFPVIETVIKGDSVIVYDTVQGEGIIITETITVKDTVTITKTLPPKVITKNVYRVDTIVKENKAAIKACEISRDQALQIATDKTAEATIWKKKAKNRFWTLVGVGGAGLLVAGLMLRRKIKKA